MEAMEKNEVEIRKDPPENTKKWYQGVSLEEAELYISAGLKTASRSVIAVGYYLKCVRDGELYREAGHASIWDYAFDRFGFSRSTASRYMSRNDKFSEGGNSPILAEQYKDFNKSQLQEMLSLDEAQMEQVTPEMTVQQIRALKQPKEIPYVELPGQINITDFPGVEPDHTLPVVDEAPEAEKAVVKNCEISVEDLMPEPEPLPVESVATSHIESLSAYGTPKREYPAGSLIAASGCKGGHYCDCCSMECGIRQEDRWCREAPCGNPFPCETMRYGLDEIREQVGAACQFINHDLAYHRSGDREPDPCFKECENPCEFICGRAMKTLDGASEEDAAETQQIEAICCDNSSEVEPKKTGSEFTDMDLLRGMLEKEKALLDEMIKVDKTEELPENMIRKKKLLVIALAGMLCDLDTPDLEEPEQPELPVMKNNDQRKAWLRDYQSWGLWYTDEHIGARYYKYDFDNGAKLIAEVYSQHNEFAGLDYESSYLHLVGGPEPAKHPSGAYGKWTRHETYNRCPDSETELVEFLKELQKGEKR